MSDHSSISDICAEGFVDTGMPSGARTAQLSELAVLADCVRKGYKMFLPFNHALGCDLVAVKEKQVVQIEVKTVVLSAKGKIMNWQCKHNADVLAVAFKDGRVEYFPPIIQ